MVTYPNGEDMHSINIAFVQYLTHSFVLLRVQKDLQVIVPSENLHTKYIAHCSAILTEVCLIPLSMFHIQWKLGLRT